MISLLTELFIPEDKTTKARILDQLIATWKKMKSVVSIHVVNGTTITGVLKLTPPPC